MGEGNKGDGDSSTRDTKGPEIDSHSREDIRHGLLLHGTRCLPPWFLYDDRGSAIFERITELPEYYPFRAESEILQRHAASIAQSLVRGGGPLWLVELGSGSSVKTQYLLDALVEAAGGRQGAIRFIPIDVSEGILLQSAQRIRERYAATGMQVTPLVGRYVDVLQQLSQQSLEPNTVIAVAFLGGSVGNFSPTEAQAFLMTYGWPLVSRGATPESCLLLSVDLVKDEKTLIAAYDDSQGVTREFNYNLLRRLNQTFEGNLPEQELPRHFRYSVQWIPSPQGDAGSVRMGLMLQPTVPSLTVTLRALDMSFTLAPGELLKSEDSNKYSLEKIRELALDSGFSVKPEEQFLDSQRRFAVSIARPLASRRPQLVTAALRKAWHQQDVIFSLITDLFARPIYLRHQFIFYLGHLPAFSNILLTKACNEVSLPVPDWCLAPEMAAFERLFERGIDPDVNNPERVHHSHSVVPTRDSDWPATSAVRARRDTIRQRVLQTIPDILGHQTSWFATNGHCFSAMAEHDLMHVETLCYMLLQAPLHLKQPVLSGPTGRPVRGVRSPPGRPRTPVAVSAGCTRLGRDLSDGDPGWDLEFGRRVVHCDHAFEVDPLPVTIGEYHAWMQQAHPYDDPACWSEEGWAWVQANKVRHPASWRSSTSEGAPLQVLSMFDLLPLSEAADWPVYCSYVEAEAYARAHGRRIMTEVEYNRAAYGDDHDRCWPWKGPSAVPGRHGNWDFRFWSPSPVGLFPHGATDSGIQELVGNGYEHTSTPLEAHEGFSHFYWYEGYSKDFFDGRHNVMLGASWATDATLVRRSFRNWYQRIYPFMFAKFRTCKTLV